MTTGVSPCAQSRLQLKPDDPCQCPQFFSDIPSGSVQVVFFLISFRRNVSEFDIGVYKILHVAEPGRKVVPNSPAHRISPVLYLSFVLAASTSSALCLVCLLKTSMLTYESPNSLRDSLSRGFHNYLKSRFISYFFNASQKADNSLAVANVFASIFQQFSQSKKGSER